MTVSGPWLVHTYFREDKVGGGGGLEPAEPYAGSSKPLVLICKSTAHVQAHTSGSTVVLPI